MEENKMKFDYTYGDNKPSYALAAPKTWNFVKDCYGVIWSRSEWDKLSVFTRRDRLPIVRGYAFEYVNQGLEETNDICTHVELKAPWDEFRTASYAPTDGDILAREILEDMTGKHGASMAVIAKTMLFGDNEDAKKLSKAPVCIGYTPYKGAFVSSLAIDRVIFNDPATIIIWTDGTKTVVKCGGNDTFDPEKGFAIAVVKKLFGNSSRYYDEFKKWIPQGE